MVACTWSRCDFSKSIAKDDKKNFWIVLLSTFLALELTWVCSASETEGRWEFSESVYQPLPFYRHIKKQLQAVYLEYENFLESCSLDYSAKTAETKKDEL